MDRFSGKIVVVTGATSGIGAAAAVLFAKEGASVVLIGRNVERGRDLESKILEIGQKAWFISCDVSQEKEVKDVPTGGAELWPGRCSV